MAPLSGKVKDQCPFCGRRLALSTLRYKHRCGVTPGRPMISAEALKEKAVAALAERLKLETPEEQTEVKETEGE